MGPDTVSEPARQTPVVHRADVLVVGSGPGGLAAALAGVDVALVERVGCFGGNLTVVGVEGFAWYRHEETVEAGGIGREFEERAKAMRAAVPESQSLSYEIDSEGFKLVADGLVEEAGVHPMLHRLFVTPVEEMQAASVMFRLAGIDKDAFLAGVRADPQTYADWSAGEWQVQTDGKEDGLFSPFLREPFARAIRDGVMPAELSTIAGTWGAVRDTGELTYMSLPPRGL